MFCWNWLKLRVTVQLVMQKGKVVKPKTQRRFVDSHESSVGSWSGGRGFNRLLDLLI